MQKKTEQPASFETAIKENEFEQGLRLAHPHQSQKMLQQAEQRVQILLNDTLVRRIACSICAGK